MTDKNKEKKLEDFVNIAKAVDEINKLTRSAEGDPRTKLNESATNNLNKEVVKFYKQFGLERDINTERISKEQRDYVASILQRQAADYLYENKKDIIPHIPENQLEILARTEEISKEADGNDKEIISAYQRYKGLESLAKSYEKGERLGEREEEVINDAVVKGIIKVQKEKFKEKSKQEQKIAESLAIIAAKSGSLKPESIKKYALIGLKDEIEKAKKTYKEKGDIKEAVTNTVYRLVEDKDPERFGKAYNLVSQAARKKLAA